MGQMHCKNITSVKRHLPEGSNLLLGDQILNGIAIKEGTSQTSAKTEAEILKDDVAASVFGIETGTVDLSKFGEQLGAGDFITEGGFVAGPDGADVIHSGFGGEARAFAPGTELRQGDIVLNGRFVDPDGVILDAPFQIDNDGFTVADDGAVVSPGGGADDADAYCSLQELAGRSDVEGSPLDDLDLELDLDLDIPGLDFAWWVKIQAKINDLMMLAGKFLAKTQNLVALVDLNPDDACRYLPDVSELIKIMNKALRIISAIEKIMRAVEKIISKIEKALKLLEWVFAPLKIVKAWLAIINIIRGIPQLIRQAAKTLTDTSKLIPQLIALLNKILAQCAANQGADAGLSKEECEALGGIYVDRRLGDLGDSSGGGLNDGLGLGGFGDGSGDGSGSGFRDDLDLELDFGYMGPGTDLNSGDQISDGSVFDYNTTPPTEHMAPIIIPGDGWKSGDDGATGVSDSVKVSNDRLESNIDRQILDLSQCMTELEDFEKTANWR